MTEPAAVERTPASASLPIARFGVFEADFRSRELRRRGVKVRLAEQPFQVLALLLERPGEVVTRQELRQRLWSTDTFVDFDTGLNSAIRKLREALDDSAENPRFIETLPRRGYRFIGSLRPATPEPMLNPGAGGTAKSGVRISAIRIARALVAVVLTIGMLLLGHERGSWQRPTGGTSPEQARAIVSAIDGGLRLPPRRAGIPPGINPDAYDSYMKGVFACGQQTYEGYRTGIAYFETAVAKQPDFALAYAAMSSAQLQFLYMGPLSPREVIPKAEGAAQRALQLDETLPLAHQALARILQLYYWRWDEADKEDRRARQLTGDARGPFVPSFDGATSADERTAKAAHPSEVDPLSVGAIVDLALAYRKARQYDRAIKELHRAVGIDPGRGRPHFQLGITFVQIGRWTEAIRELEIAVKSSSDANPRFEAYLGYAYAAAGRPGDARRVLRALESRARQQYVSSFGLALIHDALGEKEAALTALERAYEDHAVEFSQMSQYPTFTTIASDARFHDVLSRIGLPR